MSKPTPTPTPTLKPIPKSPEEQWMVNHFPNCTKDLSTTDSKNLCLQDINKLSCKDIKNFVTVIKTDPRYAVDKKKLTDALDGLIDDINNNKNIIENIVNSSSLIIGKINCFLYEINNQILVDDKKKFDLLEINKLKDTIITNLGGCASSCKRGIWIIMGILVILLVVFIILYLTK